MQVGLRRTRVLSVLVLLALLGCSRRTGDVPGVAIDLTVTPSAPRVGQATVAATLRDASGRPIRQASVEFEGTMSHAGMPPVQVRATETAAGRYEAPIDFTMAGEWVIIVRATLSNGQTLERPITLGNVRAN